MPFEDLPDGRGKIYIPDWHGKKKHACPDCFACLHCSDDRCSQCRKPNRCRCPKAKPREAGKG